MVSADRAVVAGEKGPFHYMLEAFSRHWDRVDVIGTRPERVEQTTVFGNVHLHHPTTGKLRQAGFVARTGLALAAERPYTVITSHDYNPFYNGWGSWRISRGAGVPYVAELHHVPGHPRPADLRERVDKLVTRRYVGWALKRAAGFRVVNDSEMPALLRRWGVPEERIHVLPSMYLDREVFTPAPTEPRCDLLLVGRLVPNKGIGSVLEALRRGRDEHGARWRLRILGRGPEGRRIDAFAARHRLADQVERIDWVPDAAALAGVYREARVLVCASLSEGGPRVVPEAMACGTPVISTPVGIVPDLVTHGVDGLVYDGSVDGLLAALRRVLGDRSGLDPADGAGGAPDGTAIDGERDTLAARLPPEGMERFDREAVIGRLAEGLQEIAARWRAERATA